MSAENNSSPRWIAGVEPPAELLSLGMVPLFEYECREQPTRLYDLLRAYSDEPLLLTEFEKLRQLTQSPGPLLFIGMGASYCSALAGSYWLQAHGLASFTVDAGEWLHYGLPSWHDSSGSILLTTSGESAELVELFRRDNRHPIALLCNNDKSPCWSLAQLKFPILAGPEYGNATKTFTNATAGAIILASRLLGLPWRPRANQFFETYSETLDAIFARRKEFDAFIQGAANLELIGRGPGYASAFMGALCIREMSGLRAAPHTGAGFRHGPLLDISPTHVALIFALGRTASLGVKLAQDCNAKGGKVILVSSEDHPASDILLPVKLPAVPEPWDVLTSILVPQALTLAIIERAGANLKPRFQYGAMEQ